MKKILFLIPLLSFVACKEVNDDVVAEPNKDGSIETKITTTHNGDYDVLTTEYVVWVKGKVEKNFVKRDTLKSLGSTTEEAEDSDGNVQTVSIPKDYEIFITVN